VSDIKKNLGSSGIKYSLYLLAACVFLAMLEFIINRHSDTNIEAVFLFYGLVGIVSVLIITLGASLLGKLVSRAGDYYDAD